ncbi:MAG: DNA alkylation repair protein [Chitinophagales bacterium]
MTTNEVLKELQALGSESTKKVLLKHGAKEPFYGVKVQDMKKVLKKIKGDQQLAMDLYNTGVSDAMYLAGLSADGAKMTKKQLQDWAKKAHWYMISEYTVPWVATESPYGWELAKEWIEAKEEMLASIGWATLSMHLSVKPDEEIDFKWMQKLLQRIKKDIHKAPNRVRYTMNGFILCLAGYCPALTKEALTTAKEIGEVMVDMGGTACKVPSVADYIKKMEARGVIGKKRKMVKC